MAMRPFLLYGDSPGLPSGLGRIGRDIMARVVAEQDDLGVFPAHVGIAEPEGLDWQAWPHYRFLPSYTNQGEEIMTRALGEVQQATGGVKRPVILTVMDAARCYALTSTFSDQAALWCYVPIDGATRYGDFGGPARIGLQEAHRVLAYGQYGARVLKNTLGAETPVQYIPHGIEWRTWWTPAVADPFWMEWHAQLPPHTVVVGAVATNQIRKDFGVLCASILPLQQRLQRPVALWLHTDLLTKVWDIGELARVNGLHPARVCVSTPHGGELSDAALAGRYQRSTITIAPGLGEGFGYPIAESLAAGTPVVHVDAAGGAELIPTPRWRVTPSLFRDESVYVIQRPVLDPSRLADVAARAVADAEQPWCAGYCRGSVRHLDWEVVWPVWRSWIVQGLRALDAQEATRGNG